MARALSYVAMVSAALEDAQAVIDVAGAHRQRLVEIDVARHPVDVIEALIRALRLRGYCVMRSTRTESGHVYPLLRVGSSRPEPQLAGWDDS